MHINNQQTLSKMLANFVRGCDGPSIHRDAHKPLHAPAHAVDAQVRISASASSSNKRNSLVRFAVAAVVVCKQGSFPDLLHPHADTPQELVLSVLGSLPSPREARSFLKRFKPTDIVDAAAHEARVGIVRIDMHDLTSDGLASAAATLVNLRRLGLFPVVVPAPRSSSGSQKPLAAVQSVYADVFAVADALERAGGRARPLCDGVFTPGAAGVSASTDPIRRILDGGQIPVVGCVGMHENVSCASVRVPISTSAALLALANEATRSDSFDTPVKFIIVNRNGGIDVPSHPVASFVDLSHDYELICARLLAAASQDSYSSSSFASSLAQDLELIRTILNILPPTASAVVTSAETSASLIANLITDKPFVSLPCLNINKLSKRFTSNQNHSESSLSHSIHNRSDQYPHPPTLLRRGLPIEYHDSTATVNLTRLTRLLEASFQKQLHASEFYDRLSHVGKCIMIAGDYEGAVIVTHETDLISNQSDLPYLDKFAVAPSSQGRGVADILWARLRAEFPDLCWRSRCDNPVNKWYFERSDGNMLIPGGKWILFWYGPNGTPRIDAYKCMAANIPASFGARSSNP